MRLYYQKKSLAKPKKKEKKNFNLVISYTACVILSMLKTLFLVI